MSADTTAARPAAAPAAPSRLRVWFDQHLHGLAFSLGRALRKPWATLLTIAVMGLALALPLGLSIVMDNLRHFAGSVQQSREINLFLKADVDAAAAERTAAPSSCRHGCGGWNASSAHRRHPCGASPGRPLIPSATRKRTASRCCLVSPWAPSGPSSHGLSCPSAPLPQSSQARSAASPDIDAVRRYSSMSSPSGSRSSDGSTAPAGRGSPSP